ncbi:Gim complex component GIM3-like protein [Metarhizium album ARSEF 1941]|uniref:Prefoldin subunit 4 n=1 Tax=Metarhizium album (strain ARSEF 1941) TaxID=1081103 RepID=A0A0B2X1Z0_METAS|nr:Gim complex component GIM3-like protein [Metarhizium album ARSEF 1941]KHN99180.1 Gim complex component GIM3-like protein [Metarhizium album ARSEF 1941]
MQRRMLSKEDEQAADEVEVRREDQDKINKFSRLHQREVAMEEELKLKNKEKEELDDLATELELADEDEKIQYANRYIVYKIGDAFFHIPLEQARDMLETATTKIEEEASELEDKVGSLREDMQQLKVELYARFGKQINLEV